MASRTIDFILNLKGDANAKAKELGRSMGGLEVSGRAAMASVAALASGMAAAGAAAVALRSEIANVVDETNTMAQATGLANQTIAGLRQAAAASGKELSQIVPTRLAKNMLTAAQGAKEMQRAFAAAGVEFTDTSGNLRQSDAVFRDLIDNLQTMENRTEAAALASKIMGAQGRELLSALGDSAELDRFVSLTEKYGIKVGPEAVKQTAAWQAATSKLKLAVDDIKQSLFDAFGSDTLTELVTIATGFIHFFGKVATGVLSDLMHDAKVMFDFISGGLGFEEAANKIGQTSIILGGESGAGIIGDQLQDTLEFMASGLDFSGLAFGKTGQPGAGGGAPGVAAGVAAVAGKGAGASVPVWIANVDGLPTRSGQEIIAERQLLIANSQAMLLDAQKEAIAAIKGTSGGVIFALLRGAVGLLTNLDDKIRDMTRTLVEGPANFGKSIENALTKAIPNLIAALPEIFEGLLLKMPSAIVRGIVEAVPAWVRAFGEMIADQFKKALEFFRGGEDSNVLTGRKGKFLGTSFKKGRFSLLGFFNKDDKDSGAAGGSGGGGNTHRGTSVTSRATGGFVNEDGLNFLHAGERVIPSSGASSGTSRMLAAAGGGGGGISVGTINLTVSDLRDFMRQLRREIGDLGTGGSLTPKVV